MERDTGISEGQIAGCKLDETPQHHGATQSAQHSERKGGKPIFWLDEATAASFALGATVFGTMAVLLMGLDGLGRKRR